MLDVGSVLLLLLGFVALFLGAEWLVAGAAELAAHLKISKTFIGLTLVAFGTSAPEMFVNVIAGFYGHSELALSNVVGSNLTNLCVGFGLAAIVATLPLNRREFAPDLAFAAVGPMVVVASFILSPRLELSVVTLLPMAGLVAVYLVSLLRRRSAIEPDDPTHLTMVKPVIYAIGGTVLLYVGGRLVFVHAIQLAAAWQVPEQIIGLTVVACGTSIPDVTASVVAARRGEFSIAVGNLLGSNISNVFVVLSGTMLAAGESLLADRSLLFDYTFVAFASVAFAVWAGTAQRVTRTLGVVLLVTFVTFYSWRILSL